VGAADLLYLKVTILPLVRYLVIADRNIDFVFSLDREAAYNGYGTGYA
jgi:hypothetical protein